MVIMQLYPIWKHNIKPEYRNLVKITTQLKRRIGAIHVEHTQRSTSFMTLKLPKTQAHTPLTSQLHKTSKAKNTYITVLRNSVKVSLMTNLRGTPSLPIIARVTTVTLF